MSTHSSSLAQPKKTSLRRFVAITTASIIAVLLCSCGQRQDVRLTDQLAKIEADQTALNARLEKIENNNKQITQELNQLQSNDDNFTSLWDLQKANNEQTAWAVTNLLHFIEIINAEQTRQKHGQKN